MSGLEEAMARVGRAQQLLEAVEADNEAIRGALGLLRGAGPRSQELGDYLSGAWQGDLELVLADAGQDVTPRVLSEDAAWNALSDQDELVRSLLLVIAEALAPPTE